MGISDCFSTGTAPALRCFYFSMKILNALLIDVGEKTIFICQISPHSLPSPPIYGAIPPGGWCMA